MSEIVSLSYSFFVQARVRIKQHNLSRRNTGQTIKYCGLTWCVSNQSGQEDDNESEHNKAWPHGTTAPPPTPYGINTVSTANTRCDLLRCHPSFRTPPYHPRRNVFAAAGFVKSKYLVVRLIYYFM